MSINNPYIVLFFAIITAVISQILFRLGIGNIGEINLSKSTLPNEILKIITSIPIICGLVLYSFGFLAWMSAMSKLGLSYVYPFTSLNYVLVLVFSWIIFEEPLSPIKWLGVLIIIIGIFIASKG